MIRQAKIYLFLLVGSLNSVAFAVTPIILHEFKGGPNDGRDLFFNTVTLTPQGDRLIGAAGSGGAFNRGVVYSLDVDGTGFTLLHSFSGGAQGEFPFQVIADADVIYGSTLAGGKFGLGTVYRMDSSGNNLTVLHDFKGGSNDGGVPSTGLTLVGSTLFGMTDDDGTANTKGTVFSVGTSGTDFSLLHKFSGGAADGDLPVAFGKLLTQGTKLFGTTRNGGSANAGVLFSINQDGTDFQLLHSFTGGVNDGIAPHLDLQHIDGRLYGSTSGGGVFSKGTVFSINLDGSDFQLLHSFAGGPDDGTEPVGLSCLGNKLVGATTQGGDSNNGTIFSINTDGTGFQLLYEFAGGSDDGRWPVGNLAVKGSTFYGTTLFGGDANAGTVFAFVIPEPSTMILVCGCMLVAAQRKVSL